MRINIIAALVSFCLLSATSGQAQSSGTFTTFLSGQPVVTENYVMSSGTEGLRIDAEISGKGSASSQKITTQVSSDGSSRFTIEAGGATQFSAEFRDSTVKLQIAGQPERSLPSKANLVVPNLVWHPYILLLKQYDVSKGGQQVFSAFLPGSPKDVTVAVAKTGSPKYSAGDQSVITNSFRIILAERVKIDVWTDQQNVPLIFIIESQGVKTIRKGSEALAAAISQELSGVAGKQPFTSEEVSFANEGVTLSGTLTIPRSGIAPFPAVVLISGTGLQDRDDNPGGHSLFKLIAERLSSNGIAVLRHDDRGFGKSSAPAKASSYRDLIDDTKAGVSYLRKRKEIDADHIVLAGHSEGAETAGIVAQEDSKIAGVALLAGVSRSLESIILEQALYQQALKGTVDPSATERLPDVFRTLVRAVNEAKAGKPDTSLADLNEYFRQHAAHDPAGTMKMVHCPVLILQGERDTDALAYHSVALALAAAAGGNKHVLLRIVPDIGHDFTPSSPDKTAGVEERSQPNQEILKILEQWAISLLLPKESR